MDWQPLIDAAIATQQKAYAPYSKYRVGSAILGGDGKIYAGCNVENASYGLTICAERGAIMQMVASGCTNWLAAVVVTTGEKAAGPCGACRQVLAEFCEEGPMLLLALSPEGNVVKQEKTDIDALLPGRFSKSYLTEPLGPFIASSFTR